MERNNIAIKFVFLPPIINIRIIVKNEGDSIISQLNLAFMVRPQPLREWRPYGAEVINREIKTIRAVAKTVQRSILYIICPVILKELY